MAESTDYGVGPGGVALPSNPAFEAGGIPVTMDNIVQAETAKYLCEETARTGPNRFRHERAGIQVDAQTVIRSNFDQIYSYAVFDASAGLTVTIPPFDCLQTVQIFDENHVTLDVVYQGTTAHITPSQLTRGNHVYLFMRTQPPGYDDAGMAVMREHQDAVTVDAPSARPFVPAVQYDLASFNECRAAVIRSAVEEGVEAHVGFIERIEDIRPPHYQRANVAGWGGLPARHAHYVPILPRDPDVLAGKPSTMTFAPPDLRYADHGYWSITVYDTEGWVVTERFNTNSRTATPNPDGAYTLTFNGPDGALNPIDVAPGWNGLLRCYLPSAVEDILAFQSRLLDDSAITPLP